MLPTLSRGGRTPYKPFNAVRYRRGMPRRDRGALLTRTLLGAGVVLLGVVVAVFALRSPAPKPTPATTAAVPPPATTATTAPTTAPAPGPVQIASVTPFSVTVSWQTEAPTTGRLAVSLGSGPPTLWSQIVGPARDHSATVRGLALDSDYRVDV